ncbi:MAG: universal stress protein [Actinomycetota bacterium]|nr:universal stress protein [Actinomycetota bacterium]
MTIVVGYVPTKEGRAALRRAGQECERRGVDLVVVRTLRGSTPLDPEAQAALAGDLEELSAQLDGAGRRYETREMAVSGDAADDLLQVAGEVHAELIVIGLRRRTPVGKLILGSNAQRILLDAGCPVLAVKADQV